MIGIDAITQLTCTQKRAASTAAGALVAYQGLDRVLPLPPVVHYAAGGLAVDALCRGQAVLSPSQETLMSAAMGVAGAYLAGYLLGRGPRY